MTYRVYARDWVNVYTCATASSDDGDQPSAAALLEVARDHFMRKYAGRVRPVDARIDLDNQGSPLARIWLFLPVMVGEFKHRDIAEAFLLVTPNLTEPTIVVRNSPEETELRNYGTVSLPWMENPA